MLDSSSRQFKYEPEINKIPDCPPSDYKPRTYDEAYCFIHSNQAHPNNFLPAAKKNPRRFLTQNDLKKCQAHALSFFVDKDKAVRRYNRLLERVGDNWVFQAGDCLAGGAIDEDMGVCDTPDRNSHVSLHLFKGVDLFSKFGIIEVLAETNDE